MKTTTSMCPAERTIRCANCGKWVKAGVPITTTVTPNLVTTAHAECPIREPFSALRLRDWNEGMQ